MKQIKRYLFFVLILAFNSVTDASHAIPGITNPDTITIKDDEIVFGQSGSFDGHFKPYADQIRIGILTAFMAHNNQGGIGGKKLRLMSLEDKGVPSITRKNITTMLDHGINMFLGIMGTRSVEALLDLIETQKIAVFFPWGGSEKLRHPHLSHIINGPGLIKPQIEELIRHTIEDLRLRNIALFHADGSFETQNARYAVEILNSYGIKPITIQSYNRHTMDLKTASKELINADPKVILCFATSTPTARLISSLFEQGHHGTIFLGIDSTFFVPQMLKLKGTQFAYTSSVGNPFKEKYEMMRTYHKDLHHSFPSYKPSILSFAYYVHAMIIIDGLQNISAPFSKEKLISYIESLHHESILGFPINFNPETRHAYSLPITLLQT